MRVKVRLMGVLRETSGSKETLLEVSDNSTVGSLIRRLIDEEGDLRTGFWDDAVDSPSPNALILVDGVEIKNLDGKDTPLKPDQEIVLLSVVHGG